MTKLSSHHSGKFVKILFIGDSSSGKTGSLVSLVKAGYRLKILDLDNGLDVLRSFVKLESPDLIDAVDYETIRDTIRPGNQGPIVSARAFVEGTKLMTKWTDDSIPAEGGEEEIFILDSLTAFGRSAFEWAKQMNPSAKDPRQWFFAAQQALENIVAMLTSESFKTHVILISHVSYRELQDGSTKGYASSIGSALGPIIPRYFNTLVMAETIGSGKLLKRRIRTVSSPVVDLKNPAPFKIESDYDLGTGLGELFKKLLTLD